jgi:hypothetical protein
LLRCHETIHKPDDSRWNSHHVAANMAKAFLKPAVATQAGEDELEEQDDAGDEVDHLPVDWNCLNKKMAVLFLCAMPAWRTLRSLSFIQDLQRHHQR